MHERDALVAQVEVDLRGNVALVELVEQGCGSVSSSLA